MTLTVIKAHSDAEKKPETTRQRDQKGAKGPRSWLPVVSMQRVIGMSDSHLHIQSEAASKPRNGKRGMAISKNHQKQKREYA